MEDDTIGQAATTPEATTPVEAPTEAPEAKEAPEQPEQEKPEGEGAEAPEAGAEKDEATEGETEPEEGESVDQKEAARRGFAERQRQRQALNQQLGQQYRPPTVEELMEEQGMDEREARIEAKFQELELKEQIGQIAELNTSLDLDARSIETEMSVFNEKSKDFDADFAERVSRDYIRDAQVQFAQHVDQAGRPVFNEDGSPSLYVVSARVPMYDYYQSRYQDRLAGEQSGMRRGQKAAEQMMASTDTIGAANTTGEKSFDQMSLKEKEAYLKSKGHDV